MADGRSKINDRDRVLSLLMFYLKKGDSEKQNFFTIATTAFSIALILLTVILIVNRLTNNGIFEKYLFTFVSVIIMGFLIYVIIENRWYLNRIEKNKEKLRCQLERYKIDDESEALIKIAFDEKN